MGYSQQFRVVHLNVLNHAAQKIMPVVLREVVLTLHKKFVLVLVVCGMICHAMMLFVVLVVSKRVLVVTTKFHPVMTKETVPKPQKE
jgi:hypothetical protein